MSSDDEDREQVGEDTRRLQAEKDAEIANRAIRRFLYDERIEWYRMTDEQIITTALYARRRHLPILRRRALDSLAKRKRKNAGTE